jgi:hypothetical protein
MAAPDPGLGSAYPHRQTVTSNVPPGASTYQSDQSYDPLAFAKGIAKGIGGAAGTVGGYLKGLSNPFKPATADLSGVKAAQDRAFGTQDQLAAERAGLQGNYNPFVDNQLAAQQQSNILALAQAAAGRVPSPAELQLQQRAGRNAANQYGLAAALQGRSPGGALRQASMGSVATQADANAQAAIMRAKEQADARAALVGALQSARGQGQNLLQSDMDWRKALLSGQIGALGAGTTAAGNEAQAQSQAAAAQNAYKGSLIGGGASILGALF